MLPSFSHSRSHDRPYSKLLAQTMTSAQPCENCNMIMMNYADLRIVHTQVVSQLKGAKLELKELKACSLLLGACTNCPMLKI
jgi:hypothetical protein